MTKNKHLFYKHGHTIGKRTKEYVAWLNMKRRCDSKCRSTYNYYGGRGIKVCKRWLHSFTNFLSDMKQKPTNDYSLDRINVNGNYTPHNCRWATKKQQSQNRRPRNSCLKDIKKELMK